jgi:hypothetical protein
MKRIEFIGGSGIGKSTLLREFVKMKRPDDRWMTADEAKIYLAKKVNVNKGILKRLLQIYLKIGIFKRFRVNIAVTILDDFYDNTIDSMQEYYCDAAQLFLESLYEDNNRNSIQKVALAAYYNKLLISEIMLFNYYQLDNLVVYDDSIIHNTLKFGDQDRSSDVFKNHKNSDTGVIPIGVVHCYINEEIYIKRREGRIIQGDGTVLDRTKNDDELAQLCRRALKSAADKINVLKNHRIPVLEVDMANSVKDNAEMVYDFINKLQ